jgi:hypothetical protein
VAKETGLNMSTLTAYMTQKVNLFDKSTLETLCIFPVTWGMYCNIPLIPHNPKRKPPVNRAVCIIA